MQRIGVLGAFTRVAQLTGLMLLSVGWTNPLRPPTEGEKPELLAADSVYMAQLYKQHYGLAATVSSSPIPIDLADEGQHQFVMRRLRAAGKTPENAPHLFARLNQVRERALARRASGQTELTTTATTDWFCDHLVTVARETSGSGLVNYETNPVASCEGGADYVYADISTYDANLELSQLLPVESNAGEEYSGGQNYNSVVVTPSVPSTGSRQLFADSMMVAMNETTGEEIITYTGLNTAALDEAAAIDLKHPSLSPVHDPVTAPYILFCQMRGGSGCDYAVVNSALQPYVSPITGVAQAKTISPWVGGSYFELPASMRPYDQTMLYIPISFHFNSGKQNGVACTITNVKSETSAKLIKTDKGGTCSGIQSLQTQLQGNLDLQDPRYRNGVSYIGLLRFQRKLSDVTGCTMQEVLNQAVEFKLSVVTEATCGGTEIYTRRDDYGLSDLGYKNLFFLNSCMAAGTLIKRADGSTELIENLQLGDKVLANDKGLVLTVVDVAHGGELKPLVHVRDEHGHEVKLTEEHPVIMASGKVVPASALKLKDRVRTEKGVSSLVSVQRVAYEGQVYNLTLGTPEELARAGLQNRTLFANGFLLGDNAMQNDLSKPPKLSSKEALERLPKSWRKDFNRRPVLASTVKQ